MKLVALLRGLDFLKEVYFLDGRMCVQEENRVTSCCYRLFRKYGNKFLTFGSPCDQNKRRLLVRGHRWIWNVALSFFPFHDHGRTLQNFNSTCTISLNVVDCETFPDSLRLVKFQNCGCKTKIQATFICIICKCGQTELIPATRQDPVHNKNTHELPFEMLNTLTENDARMKLVT